jgi:hypothetical protein
LSDLIREEFGFRITFFMMIGILIINFGNVVGEFAGIARQPRTVWPLPKYITVPVCAVIVWLIPVKGHYKSVEKVFLAASFFYVTYIFAGLLRASAWIERHGATVKPPALKAAFMLPSLPVHGDRRRRHDDRPLDAVLPAILDRGERRHQAPIQSFANRRDYRLHFYRHRGLVHHRGLRRHAWVHGYRDIKTPPTPPRPCAPRRRLRLHFVCGRLFNASLFAASILPLSTAIHGLRRGWDSNPAWG